MKVNYKNWFYESHKYLKTTDTKEFIDTKNINQNKVLLKLHDLSLLSSQPFGIVGNKKGFDRLIDLMQSSNYTFDDINDSLIETYKMSLSNAMSRSLVNTHAIVFNGTPKDKQVTAEGFSHYYIIDIPYDQMHMGDRDSFIKDRLPKMNTIANGQYIDYSEFVSSSITKYLGFTFVCCGNGFIVNDCKIAFNDHGFKFKIGWKYSESVTFTVYKLDTSKVFSFTNVNMGTINRTNSIPYDSLGLKESVYDEYRDKKFLCVIYDPNYAQPSPPNFASFKKDRIDIPNLQSYTRKKISEKAKVNVVLVQIDYLNELKDVYPAICFENLIDKRVAYDENGNRLVDRDSNTLYVESTNRTNEENIKTPPIVLDRPVMDSFYVINNLLSIRPMLESISSSILAIGTVGTSTQWMSLPEIIDNIITPYAQTCMRVISDALDMYKEGAIVTSLIPSESIEYFESIYKNIYSIYNLRYSQEPDVRTNPNAPFAKLQTLLAATRIYFGDGYKKFIDTVCSVYMSEETEKFVGLNDLNVNWYDDYDYKHFKRPVSEQNFIVLKYNKTEGCWLFNVPDIEHFAGIGNTFYLNNLNGDEIFKIFVLYTDTESPEETACDQVSLEQSLDFDKFEKQIIDHIGYIRYWYAENRLAKLAQMYFSNGYRKEFIISKILRRKELSPDLLYVFPSEINYEASNISTNGDDTSAEFESPFAINFLFYTLNQLNGNEDKLQSFFYDIMTRKKYEKRYVDYPLTEVIDKSIVNFVDFTKYTSTPAIHTAISQLEGLIDNVNIFYGYPRLLNASGQPIPETVYPYTYNSYVGDTFYLYRWKEDDDNIGYEGYQFDTDTYLRFDDTDTFETMHARNDLIAAKYLLQYLSDVQYYLSILETNYAQSWLQIDCCKTFLDQLDSDITQLNSIKTLNFFTEGIREMIDAVTNTDDAQHIRNMITDMIAEFEACQYVKLPGVKINYIELINKIISEIRYIHTNFGFTDQAEPNVRKLYLHLKNINQTMNSHQYEEFLLDPILEILPNLGRYVSLNENNDYSMDYLCITLTDRLYRYIDTTIASLNTYQTLLNRMEGYRNTTGTLIRTLCASIINNMRFDMYSISNITFEEVEYTKLPRYITIDVDVTDKHFKSPLNTESGIRKMYFIPIYNRTSNGTYTIRNIVPLANYAIFDDEEYSVDNGVLTFIDGSTESIAFNISFVKVSPAGALGYPKQLIPEVNTTNIEFQSKYEYTSTDNGNLITGKTGRHDYELLYGNKFMTLDHEEQLILNPKTYLPGPVDIIHLENSVLNDMIMTNYGVVDGCHLYVKPVQVKHLPADASNVINGIGGKYYVGEKVYLQTDDKKYIFPVRITQIDHSEYKGFIEATVDQNNAKWMELTIPGDIERYLIDDIQCKIVDDNIRNFLDEFSNPDYESFYVVDTVKENTDDRYDNMYSLPGDPLFVQNNADYVHTRVAWFFSDIYPNRFIDEDHKKYNFLYITNGNFVDDVITINMLSHNFNPLSIQQQYPILRTEPNDADIWEREKATFYRYMYECEAKISANESSIARYRAEYVRTTDEVRRQKILAKIERLEYQNIQLKNQAEKYQYMIYELEKPTSWFNVHSYESAIIYTQNGRSVKSISMVDNVRDLLYTDKLEVYMYDKDNHVWLDPKDFEITITYETDINIDNPNDFKTGKVNTIMKITPKNTSPESKNILVYFAYEQSNVFDDIELNDEGECSVVFKAVLSVPSEVNHSIDLYRDINIRKHFETIERYKFNEYDDTDKQYLIINRKKYCDEYDNTPVLRFRDIKANTQSQEYDYTNFDLYIPNPFKDVKVSPSALSKTISFEIVQPIRNFTVDETIDLICVQNDDVASFNGVISNMMIKCKTSSDAHGQSLELVESIIPSNCVGTYTFTCVQKNQYNSEGGVIKVTISNSGSTIPTVTDWVLIPENKSEYYELPEKFVLKPKSSIPFTEYDPLFITISLQYYPDNVNADDEIGELTPYDYLYDSKNHHRLPFSDVINNDITTRFTTTKQEHPEVNKVTSTYVHVCRYSKAKIDESGIIDLTGMIPTPLSFDRYEFWINGRQLTDKNVTITSPTTLQLTKLTSLRNFEVIELVDDFYDSTTFPKEMVYISNDGKRFNDYVKAMKYNMGNGTIISQELSYSFNVNNHTNLDTYYFSNPENVDVEPDILESFMSDDSFRLRFNGVDVNNATLDQLNVLEIPASDVNNELNKVWKFEEMTDGYFDIMHTLPRDITATLHMNKLDDGSFDVYVTGTYNSHFTAYITSDPQTDISDSEHTQDIMTNVTMGMIINIPKSYSGNCFKTTINDDFIRLI